jgi:hypothetical protein
MGVAAPLICVKQIEMGHEMERKALPLQPKRIEELKN